MKRVAAVDLGTNTVRLLVGEARPSEWRPLLETQRVTRLGEGQAARGALGDAPMRRTTAVVAEFVERARALGAEEIRIVATSAVRDASNRDDLLAAVRAACGCSVEVISGEDEARLTLLGVSAGLPALGGSFLLFDIGGGSTEFVLAESARPAVMVSLRLGVVALAERHTDAGPVDLRQLARLEAAIDQALSAGLIPGISGARSPELVGTAGTVTTLAALDLELTAYDAARVQGHRLTRRAIEVQLARLAGLTVSERAALPCLERGRADLIVPGAAICLAVLTRLGFDSLIVSDRGLREGILYEILSKS
ncbi:MAG TPA: Ppx/GppA phosphatase family protein [Methylomirabilota bacterium]|nr:Ppx/GppA phosphatase family protein [Methylomirabilota bacterium]